MTIFLILLAAVTISASIWLKMQYSRWHELPLVFKALLLGGAVFTIMNFGYLEVQIFSYLQQPLIMFTWAVFALIFFLAVFSRFRSVQE